MSKPSDKMVEGASDIVLPADIKEQLNNVDPDSPKAVLNLVLNAYERGLKMGKELCTPRRGFWE